MTLGCKRDIGNLLILLRKRDIKPALSSLNDELKLKHSIRVAVI